MCLNHSLILSTSTSSITLLASDKKEYAELLKLEYNPSLRRSVLKYIDRIRIIPISLILSHIHGLFSQWLKFCINTRKNISF